MLVVGIDEVGRGCWAGPLVAAAVILSDDLVIPNLNDSKKLSRLRRLQLDVVIRSQAMAYGIGWVTPEQIDENGLTWAVSDAMQQACDALLLQIPGEEVSIIIDGNYNYLPGYERVQVQVGADGVVPAVSAASIIAKVARDKYMAEEAHVRYPGYGFDAHVGYGTTAHTASLARLGVTPIHRLSYKPVRRMLQSDA